MVAELYGAFAFCEIAFLPNSGLASSILFQEFKSVSQTISNWVTDFLPLLQGLQTYLQLINPDSILFGIYAGEILGVGYGYLAQATGSDLFS